MKKVILISFIGGESAHEDWKKRALYKAAYCGVSPSELYYLTDPSSKLNWLSILHLLHHRSDDFRLFLSFSYFSTQLILI